MWLGLETLLVGAVLGAGLVFLSRSLQPRRLRRLVATLIMLSVTAVVWAGWQWRRPPITEEQVRGRPIAIPADTYVTSQSCRSCHPREHATWYGSYHRKMTQTATPDSVLGHFDGRVLPYHGKSYRLFREGDTYWFEVDGERRQIRLTTGSHHMQAYWYEVGHGRAQEFFPFIFLVPEQQWIPREYVFLQPTVEVNDPVKELSEEQEWQINRQWNYSCLNCHTTNPRPHFPQIDTQVSEFGIACEACHGPGAEHVAANQDPRRRYGLHLARSGGDPTMLDPTELDARLGSQVCGSCHGVTEPHPEEFQTSLRTGRTYRPGDDLNDTRGICRPSEGADAVAEACPNLDPQLRFWSDGMLRVSGREYIGLVDSPCFEGGELSCFSCHQMHPQADDPRPLSEWASDQLHLEMDGNTACLQCHGELKEPTALAAHTFHAADSTGSQCYNCHMPYTSYGLLKALRSHQIDSPTVQASLETGRPNACNQCHLDKTMAWSAEHLQARYGTDVPELNAIEQSVPASLIWLLSGDAGQRALMAWSYGWQPALDASGDGWQTPFLAQLLSDPYAAVRVISSRSLRRHRGTEDFVFNAVASPQERRATTQFLMEQWHRQSSELDRLRDARRLVEAHDGLPDDPFAYLFSRRDDRVVMLTE